MAYAPLFVVGQTDTLPSYTVSLTYQSGKPVNLSTALSVTFNMSNAFTGLIVFDTATIVNATAGIVSYAWTGVDTLTPGVYVVEWGVNWSDLTTSTYPLRGYDFVTIVNDLAIGYPNVTPTFNTIWNSGAAPLPANGNNGDFWYDTVTGFFYGPKNNGAWPSGFILNPTLVPLNNLLPPTGNLNLNGNKVINLQNGGAPSDAAAFGQIPQMGLDITQPPYSADPTGGSDCTPALNSALTSLNANGGGTILFPAGKYLFNGSAVVTINSMSNIRLQGVGGFSPTGGSASGTIFSFTGATGDFIQCINSFGVSIRDIAFNETSATWSGNYINCATTGDLTHNLLVENCYFYGGSGAGTALNLENSQTVAVRNCFFVFGAVGINGSNSTLTSNQIDITDCYFASVSTASIQNPSISWNIKSCFFTGLGILHTTGVPSTNLLVEGCTFGPYTTTNAIKAYGYNVNVIGNSIASNTGVYIDTATTGLVVKGNYFASCITAVQTVDTTAADVSSNFFDTCSTNMNYNSTSTDLATNGSFKGGLLTGWTPINSAAPSIIYTDSVGNTGECMQLLTNGSAFGGSTNASFTGVANTTYQAGVWVKIVTGGGLPQLTIKDTTNSVTGVSGTPSVSGVWTYLSASVTSGSSTPTMSVFIETTSSTAATRFNVAMLVIRAGNTPLPSHFSLNYVGNQYDGNPVNITGNYTQCGLVESPIGTITQYGGQIFSGAIAQANGYDTVLGNNAYVPNNLSLGALATAGSYGGGAGVIAGQNAATAPTSNPSGGGVQYWVNGAPWNRGSDGTIAPMISPSEFGGVIPGAKASTLAPSQPTTSTQPVAATGVTYMAALWLPAGLTMSNINFIVGTSSTVTQTHAWAGLADNTGKVLAVTADRTSTVFTASATTPITMTFTGSFTTAYTGIHYILFSCSTSGTMPALVGIPTPNASVAAAAVQAGSGPTQAAPPSLGATLTPPTTQTLGICLFWLT